MQTYPAQLNSERILNDYAQDYLNTVKENRSQYGNFVDNNLTYDPYKEQKSVYNVVYETDAYNPWGKPGGGAPKVDQNGNIKNKIVGTLRWNLNGETEQDRLKRLAQNQKNTNNVLLYKKEYVSPQSTPRIGKNDVRQATTYNYNFRDPYINSSQSFGKPLLPPISNSYQNLAPNQPTQINSNTNISNPNISYDMTRIEQEAQLRNMNKSFRPNHFKKQGDNDFNLISNKLYRDNKPSDDHPNDSYWFGRAGPARLAVGKNAAYMSNSAPPEFLEHNVGRKNLLEILENPVAYRKPNLQNQSSSNNFGSNSQFVN